MNICCFQFAAFNAIILTTVGVATNFSSINFPNLPPIQTNYIWHVQTTSQQQMQLIFHYGWAYNGISLSSAPITPGYGFLETSQIYYNDELPSKMVVYESDIWILFPAYDTGGENQPGFMIEATAINATRDEGKVKLILISNIPFS